MNSAQMILKYWLRSKKNFVKSFIYQMIYVGISLIVPVLLGSMVGGLTRPGATVQLLFIQLALIIGLSVLGYFFNKAGRIWTAEVSTRAMYDLRKDINTSIYRQDFSYFDKYETGQLVARATSDVEQTRMIFGFGLATGLQSLVQLIGVIVAVFLLSFQFGFIYLGFIAVHLTISFLIIKKLKPLFLETREAFGDLTTTIRENIIGAEIVRIFSEQKKENIKFMKNNTRFFSASVKSQKWNSLFMPLNFFVILGITVVVIYLGGTMVATGQPGFSLDLIITFQSYTGILTFPLTIFTQIMVMYIQADAALVRIREVLESSPSITEKENPIPIDDMRGRVEFDHVQFGYTKSNLILKDLSFQIPAGKKLAILGTTGSGKSTIINLLPRFYDVDGGSIEIDGADIRDYKLNDLRKNIGIVSQETFLFNKSIRENITFGKEDAPMEEIIKAAKIADLHDFVMSLPDQYDTIVGERGARLSGGQKQRLSIARALIINPKILVFDDSTSSVDVETEYNIQNALERIMKDTTTFIITQRLSTIRNADYIMVLDKGRMVGFGDHTKLYNENVLYRQIYETLFRKQKVVEGAAVR